MSTDQLVILADGVVLGFDVALAVHFGGQIWDDYRDRRLLRRYTAEADARAARLDAALAKAPRGQE